MTARLDEGAVRVRADAGRVLRLDDLAAAARGCVACSELASARQQVVVGDQTAGARMVLVGEAPGAQEDASGRPFVGRAGMLLDELLAEVGVDRADVAVLNVVKCRPPGNRTPTRVEIGRCRGWVDRQVELLDPSLVVTLGGTALAWAFGPGRLLRDLRGRAHDWNGRRLLPTYHPSAALRFGPKGMPRAALRDDLRLAAELT
jgi:uracil-DNA glycosylase family 4